jgi:cell division protein FtsL
MIPFRSPQPETPRRPDAAPRSSPQPELQVVDRRVRARRRRRARARLAGTAGVIGLLVVVFALVGIHVLLAQNQFQLDRLNARAAKQAAQYDRLRLQVAQLASPERVVAAAVGRLGMEQPPGVTYLTPAAPEGGPSTQPAGSSPQPAGSSTQPAGSSTAAPGGVPSDSIATADWAVIKPQLGAHP